MIKHRLTSMMAITIAFAVGFACAQRSGGSGLTAEDYNEIQRLLWTNHQGFDFATQDNADLWLSTFLPDGEIHNSGRVVAGEDEIREFALGYYRSDPDRKMRHWTSTFYITPNDEGATLSAFWYIMTQESGQTGLRIGPAGRYESTVVKTADGWRIKKHGVFMEGMVTSLPIT